MSWSGFDFEHYAQVQDISGKVYSIEITERDPLMPELRGPEVRAFFFFDLAVSQLFSNGVPSYSCGPDQYHGQFKVNPGPELYNMSEVHFVGEMVTVDELKARISDPALLDRALGNALDTGIVILYPDGASDPYDPGDLIVAPAYS